MSRRKRWQNVHGTESRVKEPKDRLATALAGTAAALARPFLAHRPTAPLDNVLVLRLDRIGDVLMSLPAIRALRAELPLARLTLAVGEWSREIASDAPVDEVVVWSAPWVGRRDEGAASSVSLFQDARRFAARPPDLALDLQGDVRAMWLMAATGASNRVGYANTGSASLLTRIIPLDEDVSFVEQNYQAIECALLKRVERTPFRWLAADARERGRQRLLSAIRDAGISNGGPIVGIHAGAGRSIKEWPVERFAAIAKRLAHERKATIVATGSPSEAEKTRVIAAAAAGAALDLAGRYDLREFAETMSAFDAFVSCDTSAMHFACALGLKSVAVFGPSDPGRYFSGGLDGFRAGGEQIVIRPGLWCAPCNLIRNPPAECAALPAPQCLDETGVDRVFAAVSRLLNTAKT